MRVNKPQIMNVFPKHRPKRVSGFRVESSYSIQKVIAHLILVLIKIETTWYIKHSRMSDCVFSSYFKYKVVQI